jgi:hypothetical protein
VIVVHLYQKLLMSTAIFAVTVASIPVASRTYYEWRSRRHDVIDELESPQTVLGCTSAGLSLADGRVVPLPGFAMVPTNSELLTAMVARGVEISKYDGRVYGLLPVWPTCGNDPVRCHITKVDIASALEFVGDHAEDGGSRFSAVRAGGWSDAEYYWYERWQCRLDKAAK